MDFARKQLEKYGWSDGKGLGKNENGISEPLKPKLKRSVTGIGHDPASEFNEHWWTALYDKAAKNVEVEDKNGKTKKIKTTSDDLVISSSTWKINKKSKNTDDAEYSEYFVRTEVLTNDKSGRKTENVRSDSESDEEVKKDVLKMTDEELFAACGGRTAHKGARHGLRATGKLARIAEQEQKLLIQPQYEGYTHAKKLREQNTKESTDIKKKKRKTNANVECESISNIVTDDNTREENNIEMIPSENDLVPQKKKKHKKDKKNSNGETINDEHDDLRKGDEVNNDPSDENDQDVSENVKEKKNKRRNKDISFVDDESANNESVDEIVIKKSKKRKNDDVELLDTAKVKSKKKKNRELIQA